MPCPHFDVAIVCRSKGQSTISAAAYQSGEKIFSEYEQKWKDYTLKDEVIHSEIMLPENAPEEFADRAELWNSVELNMRSIDENGK